jgi:hypothetical protein
MSKKHERNLNRFAHKMLRELTLCNIAYKIGVNEVFKSDNKPKDKLKLLKGLFDANQEDFMRVVSLMKDAESAESLRFSREDMSLSLDEIEEIFKAEKEKCESESKDELQKAEDELDKLIEILEKISGAIK